MRYNELIEGLMKRNYGEPRRKEIHEEAALEIIKTKCSDSINATPIYRGVRSKHLEQSQTSTNTPYMFVDTTNAKPRRSANTFNYIGLLIDALPEWQEYPKRSKSIICSTDSAYSSDFGTTYRIFPYNGSKIGVCSETDFWFSFGKVTVPAITYSLSQQYEDIFGKRMPEDDNIIQTLEELSTAMQGRTIVRQLKLLLERYQTDNLVEALSKAFNPYMSDFKLLTPNTFNIEGRHEVWTEGPAVMVNKNKVPAILKRFNQL